MELLEAISTGNVLNSLRGAMDYAGPFAPNQSDLENLIKYALDGGKDIAKVYITHQASKDGDRHQIKSEDVGQ